MYMPRRKIERNLMGFVRNRISDVSMNSVLNLIEEDRKQKLEMNPSSAFRKRKANSVNEKKSIITNILEDIKDYKIKRRELKDANRKLGTFLITYCSTCREEYELFKNIKEFDNEGNPIEKTWANYFDQRNKDYCCETCEFTSFKLKEREQQKNGKEFIDKYNSLYDYRFKTLTEYNTLGIEYRVALEQKQTLLESFEEMIKIHKETVAILIFKKNDIQWHINIIQLSVIFISCIITIFETSQKFLEQYVDAQILLVFPIVLSSYIGLVLAIGRFFKYDDKNEKIIKLIEKYSFIINKFRQKSDNYENFDFKLKELSKWKVFLDMDEKDNIGDILLKANEEKDLVLTPKEVVFYKKKYTKTRLKELMESKNFTELGDLIKSTEYPDIEISQLTQEIILRRNCCKYYFCFMWLCGYDRDYVDYNKTVLKNAIFFLKSNDNMTNNKKNITIESKMNKELKALVNEMQTRLITIEMEKKEETRKKIREKQKKKEEDRTQRNKNEISVDEEEIEEIEENSALNEAEDAFLPNTRVIAKIDSRWIKCIVDKTLCRGNNGKFLYNLRAAGGNRIYYKINGEFVRKENNKNLKLLITEESPLQVYSRFTDTAKLNNALELFNKKIWSRVKNYDTLKKGLIETFTELSNGTLGRTSSLLRSRYIPEKKFLEHLKNLNICDPVDLKNVAKFIYRKIEGGLLKSDDLIYGDWEKYFKTVFKQKIIDLDKPGFADNHIIDISSNNISENEMICSM